MIEKILSHHKVLNNLYYEKLDKIREEFDFNNQNIYFEEMQQYATHLKEKIIYHFSLQEKLKNKINSKVDKIILENMLVKDILIRMSNKIIEGAKNKDITIFNFFDDFEEILKAYLKKEEGLFLQELEMATNKEEKEKIKNILKD